MKKLILFFSVLIIAISFSSCSKMEIDKNAIVNTIYISREGDNLKIQFNTLKNESENILEKYKVTAQNIEEAKTKLEETAVNNLFLGQLQNVIITNDIPLNQILECISYFYTGYECSPNCNLLFSTKEALKNINEDKSADIRITELSKLIKEKDKRISYNIYTFYNNVNKYTEYSKVPLLYLKDQLDIKSVKFMNIDEE